MSVFDDPILTGLFDDPEVAQLWSAEARLAHMRAFEAAWSRGLAVIGQISAEEGEAAATAIEGMSFDVAALSDATARDGVPVPELVRQIKTVAEGKAVHRGATSQDVMDSATALSIAAIARLLDTRLRALEAQLDALSQRFGASPMMGRTRMQAAMEITVADRLRLWRSPLADHRARLAQATSGAAKVQYGGAAGDRADLGADAAKMATHLANALGLAPAEHAWHANRDGVVGFANVLSLITGSLGKMGQDAALMAQQGVDELTLSGGGGSSAMPHKQNPVLAELLVTLARFNAVQLGGMHQALVHEQERSGAAWSLEWMILPEMAKATGRALIAAQALVGHIEHIGSPIAPG